MTDHISEEKRREEEESQPDLAPKLIYPALARALMYNLHENALEMIENRLSSVKGPRNILVVGPGKEVLPYSENIDKVVRMLAGGNLVLMDYNATICRGIEEYLTKQGIGKILKIVRADSNFDVRKAKNTIFIQHRNIKDGYSVTNNSLSAIDMTVAVHHATQYESDIVTFCKEAKRALHPGGILHIGEGDVDMKYNERKIGKIADDLLGLEDIEGVAVYDARSCHDDPEPRKLYFGEKVDNPVTFYITERGMVSISGRDRSETGNIAKHLDRKGYKQFLWDDREITMPFIDHAMEEDFHGLIVPVRKYYSDIIDTCLERLAPELHQEFRAAITKEQSDAARGVVEFYSPPSMVRRSIEKAGLVIEETRYTKHGPFWNVAARKPDAA